MKSFDENVTIKEKYAPAMEITDPQEAAEYFEACVAHTMSFGKSRAEAESIEHQNLGYYAGYYNSTTMERVERLFGSVHPVFGSVIEKGLPSDEQAIEAGKRMAAG